MRWMSVIVTVDNHRRHDDYDDCPTLVALMKEDSSTSTEGGHWRLLLSISVSRVPGLTEPQ